MAAAGQLDKLCRRESEMSFDIKCWIAAIILGCMLLTAVIFKEQERREIADRNAKIDFIYEQMKGENK